MKRLLIAFFLFSSTAILRADDFKTIYNRMVTEYLSSPSASSVETILNQMADDGSFRKIDYKIADGSPRNHIIWLTTLAAAYNNPENKYYRSTEVEAKYLASLKFWVTTNYNASNWWFRYIAYPKELSKSVILMSDQIKKDKELFANTIKYLRWSYESADEHHMTGANGCDIIMGSLAASVLTENNEQMMDFKNRMTKLIVIQELEGISPDYMYGQHCGSGRQLYLASYGKEFINSTLFYFEFTNKTQYSSPGVSLLEDFYINGVQWVFFSKNYDPNHSGRFNNSDKFYAQFESMTNRLLKLNTARKSEIKKVYDRIKGENSLSGNRMFWRFDYMIHRQTNFMASTRMSSTRTVGAEAGNGDGEFNYYSGNGTNYMFLTGKEYSGDFFERFNYRQFPGITAEQDDEKLPISNWGVGGGNGNSFAGGVSDSIYGACGMKLDRRGLQAHKSWFYFDNEFVCLGAGINQKDGKASVFTTLNQCNSAGQVQYSVGGKTNGLKEPMTVLNPDWILHGNIGYFNLDLSSSFELACDSSLFSANVNHGTNPSDKTYAYIVRPGLQSASDASKYLKSLAISILSNSSLVQAVKHKGLNVTQILFYQPGLLKLADGKSISVDAPCALIWKENSGAITLANPNCESNNPKEIHVTVSESGKATNLIFTLPVGVFSGSSLTKILDK